MDGVDAGVPSGVENGAAHGGNADGCVGMQWRWPGGRAARAGTAGIDSVARQERFTGADDSEAALAGCGSSADQGTRALSLAGTGQHRRGAAGQGALLLPEGSMVLR